MSGICETIDEVSTCNQSENGKLTCERRIPAFAINIKSHNDSRTTERIRILDKYCLEVKYSDEFYNQYVCTAFHQYNQLAFFNDLLIGSITCRLEKSTTTNREELVVYIMTLSVLEAYRKMGVGRRLVETIINNARHDSVNKINAITLHVRTKSPALRFYKKLGFVIVEEIKDYYRELEEHDAFFLKYFIKERSNVQGSVRN